MFPQGGSNFNPPSRPGSAMSRPRPRSSSVSVAAAAASGYSTSLPSSQAYQPPGPSSVASGLGGVGGGGYSYQQPQPPNQQSLYGYPTAAAPYYNTTQSRRSSVAGYPLPTAGVGYGQPSGYSGQGPASFLNAPSNYQYQGAGQVDSGFYSYGGGGEDQFVASLAAALAQQQQQQAVASTSSQQFGFAPPDPPEVDFEEEEEPEQSKNRPKTPPDMCAVCGVTHTTEWRKGPAGIRSLCNACGLNAAKRAKDRKARGFVQPSTIEQFKMELMAIGAERFKSVDGTWTLPPDTTQRIYATIERTEKAKAMLAMPKATKKTKALEKKAAETLLFMARGGPPPSGSRPVPHASGSRPAPIVSTRRSSVSSGGTLPSPSARAAAAPYPPRATRPTRGASVSSDYLATIPSSQQPSYALPSIPSYSAPKPFNFPPSASMSQSERLDAMLRSQTPPPPGGFGAALSDTRARSRSVSMSRAGSSISRPGSASGFYPHPPPPSNLY